MPPRLQCLNAVRAFRLHDAASRATFSSTAKALTDTSSSSATQDFLSAIDTQSYRKAPVNPQGNATANESVQKLITSVSPTSTRKVLEDLKSHKLASDLTKLVQRRWKAGDVYAPHDLSSTEMKKWRKRGRPESDAFDVLDLNPIEEYKNFAIMSEYMTPLGRIKSAAETGLRAVNQRRIAKAIRRSIGLGLMPSVHRHPEILYKQNASLRMSVGKLRSY